MKLTTWNMQGCSASTENKWNTGVNNLMSQGGIYVFCLQECGAVPLSAHPLGHSPDGAILYQWGTARTARWIVFFPSDPNGNRCNLAIVVRGPYPPPLAGIMVLYPSSGPQWRPLLGVTVNGVIFFCLHAISGAGQDVSGLLTEASQNGGNNWVAAGDFNRNPDNNFPAGNWCVCDPDGDTYPSIAPQQELDFAVRNASAPAVQGTVQSSLYLSDHLPVVYDFDC